jgi:hypothetical protein
MILGASDQRTGIVSPPSQLGIVRVGVDQRSAKARNGKPALKSGVYALCEVESEAFEGTGANDEH